MIIPSSLSGAYPRYPAAERSKRSVLHPAAVLFIPSGRRIRSSTSSEKDLFCVLATISPAIAVPAFEYSHDSPGPRSNVRVDNQVYTSSADISSYPLKVDSACVSMGSNIFWYRKKSSGTLGSAEVWVARSDRVMSLPCHVGTVTPFGT